MEIDIRVKNNHFRSSFDKKCPHVSNFITKQQVFTHCTLTHMTDLMTYPYTTSHISLKSQVFSCLLTTWCDPQRSVSTWSAWRPEASAPRRWRPRWVCWRRQRSAGCGGCARTATWRRATSGDRVVRRLVCVSCFSCYLSHIGCKRSAFVPQRSSTPGFLLSHVARTLVSANVSGIERGHSSVQEYMKAEHWPAKQVICG